MQDNSEYISKEVETLLRIAGRQNFWAFCCFYDYEFFAIKRRFLKDVAIALQKVVDKYQKGEIYNIAISMPPRSGKSYITSLFCAWVLGVIKDSSVMRNTCTAYLYEKLSYDTRAVVQSDRYRLVFPEVELSADKKGVRGWNTCYAKQVSYFGGGVDGTIIGFGATFAISDDLFKSYQDAMSEINRESVHSWKQSAHNSRKEKNCPEIYVGTRWVEDDVIGRAIENGKVHEILVIPALIDGKSFCEDVKTTDEYLQEKADLERDGAEMVWNAEYMQQPLTPKNMMFGSLIKRPFTGIDFKEGLFTIAFADPADRGGDYFAVIFVTMMHDLNVYVRDVIFTKDGIEVACGRIVEKCKELNVESVFIEVNGGWVGAAKYLSQINDSNADIRPIVSPTTISKETRIKLNFEFINKRFIFSESEKHEYLAFVKNVEKYSSDGKNRNDDAPDACAQMAKIVKMKMGI